MAFTTLAHHIDIDWLKEAYRRTRKDGAVGVDGQTAQDYAVDLEGNDDEATVANRLTALGRHFEESDAIERAMITLSSTGAPTLAPDATRPARSAP